MLACAGFFACARSSAWIERQIADLEVVGSNPAGRTIRLVVSLIITHAWKWQRGLPRTDVSETTVLSDIVVTGLGPAPHRSAATGAGL